MNFQFSFHRNSWKMAASIINKIKQIIPGFGIWLINLNYKYFENCNVALIFVFFNLLIVFLVGVGLYLEASIIDHSCIPNANVVFSGCQLHLRAIENIQNFSEVRISYTNLLGKLSFQNSEHAYLCHLGQGVSNLLVQN